MLAVSASELASIQSETQAAACDKTCVVKRKTKTKDAYGSETEVLSTIVTTVAGMSEPSAGQLANYDYLVGSLSTWQVKLPVSTDVKAQDLLIIDSQTLVVQVVLDPRSYPALLTVLASEVKQSV